MEEFKNLTIVWAAINPYDEEESYNVERLDPAQEDRFHLKADIPYKPSRSYFTKKYGNDLADPAIAWWNKLTTENKDLVSPRRLDYALEIHGKNGDLTYVLDKKTGIQSLVNSLNSGPAAKTLKNLYESGTDAECIKYLANDNNYSVVINSLLRNQKYLDRFGPFLPEEKISKLMTGKPKFFDHVCQNVSNQPYKEIVEGIVEANTSKKMRDKLLKLLARAT